MGAETLKCAIFEHIQECDIFYIRREIGLCWRPDCSIDGTKPFPDTMSTKFYDTIWRHQESMT